MGRTPNFVSDATATQAEAARYALLRRLAPAMRHHLVANLQPIGMLYEVIDRRLRSPEPDFTNMHASAQKIHGFTHAALRCCLDVASWLTPEEDATIGAAEGVQECTALLAASLGLRGYTLQADIPSLDGQVRRAAVRGVLTAALIQCTDECPPPAQLMLAARATADALEVTLDLGPSQAGPREPTEPAYRPLDWADVQALAAAEAVEAARPETTRVVLGFPWVLAAQA